MFQATCGLIKRQSAPELSFIHRTNSCSGDGLLAVEHLPAALPGKPTWMGLLPVVLENQQNRATADEWNQHEHLGEGQNSMPEAVTFGVFHGNLPWVLVGWPSSGVRPLDVVPPVLQAATGSPSAADEVKKDGVTTKSRNFHARLEVRG